MALIENTLWGIEDKVKIAIERIKNFCPPEGYYLAFSGGKDSIVIKELADMAGVKYDAHYNVTTIDPPELIYYIRKYHKNVYWERPKIPFLKQLETRGYPQRQRRWCCDEYKERGGQNRIVMTGVRWEESKKRSGRRMVEKCFKDGSKTYLNAIIDWTELDVWEFIRQRKLPYCTLYDQGFTRIGCLFCPMAQQSARMREIARYPRLKAAFIKSFEKLYENKKKQGKTSVDYWKNGADMFGYWINNQTKDNPDQTIMFE